MYSVDSVSSMSTVTTDDDGPLSLNNAAAAIVRPESPTTPKASNFQGRTDYFDTQSSSNGNSHAGPSRLQGALNTTSAATLTPKRSFLVRSRKQDAPLSPSLPNSRQVSASTANRPRSQSRPEAPTHSQSHIRPAPAHQGRDPDDDIASLYGEQGSDWGDDEDQFEWLDTQGAPEAMNGSGKNGSGAGLSPSKRLSRIKAAVKPVAHGPGHEGRRLKKQLTFARRAPPPPADREPAPPPVFTETGEALTPPTTAGSLPAPTLRRGLSRSARFHGNPLQPTTSQPSAPSRPLPDRTQSTPSTATPTQSFHQPIPMRKPPPTPIHVPLKEDGGSAPMAKGQSRNSQMSFQSVAYSLYDLDGDSTSPAPSPGPGTELVFPKGRYTRVKASVLDVEANRRVRKGSDRSMGSGQTIGRNDALKTPEDYVAAGIEARGRGDLAKSAWYFMQAIEGGSLTGKMYYGESRVYARRYDGRDVLNIMQGSHCATGGV